MSHVASEGAKESIEVYQKVDPARIFIHIEGAVKYPGTYETKKGCLIKEIIEKAELLPEADCIGIDLNGRVTETLSLYVPDRGWIEVTVLGAVKEEKTLQIRSKSRICDLLSKIEMTSDADRRFLRRKRVLKDGEEVIIPRKKEKK
jgi:hypothetical protein